MYTYTNGYTDEIVTIQKDQWLSGASIGIVLMGPVWVPWMPGNPCNATTFDFPVIYEKIRGDVRYERIISSKIYDDVLEATVDAVKSLQSQGARAVASNCGYLGHYQKLVAAAVDIPVYLSSLTQIPLVQIGLRPDQKVGVMCTDGDVMKTTPQLLANCGVTDLSRIVIGGAEGYPEYNSAFNGTGKGSVNNKVVEQELVDLANNMVRDHPEIGAFVFECTEMPPPMPGPYKRRPGGLSSIPSR